MNTPLTDDELCVLCELHREHLHPLYPHEWMQANHLSGPIGAAQAKAFRGLLRRGLVIRKRGSKANRYRRWLWRLSEEGFKLMRESI